MFSRAEMGLTRLQSHSGTAINLLRDFDHTNNGNVFARLWKTKQKTNRCDDEQEDAKPVGAEDTLTLGPPLEDDRDTQQWVII